MLSRSCYNIFLSFQACFRGSLALITRLQAMSFQKYICISLLLILTAASALAQDKKTGGLKGKVSVESGPASGINILVEQDEREVTRTTTNSNGSFQIMGLAPGLYDLTFSKTGLSSGTLSKVEVRAGKVRDLNNRMALTIDEGSLAFLRGSVFDPVGRSVRGARVELARVAADGTAKKIDGRLTNESGQFVFRLTPEQATYRVTVKIAGAETTSKDVEIDGAAVYRIALSLKPAGK